MHRTAPARPARTTTPPALLECWGWVAKTTKVIDYISFGGRRSAGGWWLPAPAPQAMAMRPDPPSRLGPGEAGDQAGEACISGEKLRFSSQNTV